MSRRATKAKLEPCDMPRSSAEHLFWRLSSVRPEAAAGWFLFDGAQINTMVRGLQSHIETGRAEVKL